MAVGIVKPALGIAYFISSAVNKIDIKKGYIFIYGGGIAVGAYFHINSHRVTISSSGRAGTHAVVFIRGDKKDILIGNEFAFQRLSVSR